jgi:hypothetical protein
VVEIAWRHHLAELCENEPLWHALSSCTEEAQKQLLPPAPAPPPARPAGPGHVPRQLRAGLRRYVDSPLLAALDQHARALAANAPLPQPPAAPLFAAAALPGGGLELALPDAHVRRLCHSVAHYYGLCSKSITLPSGVRVTHLKRPKKASRLPLPDLNIIQYLRQRPRGAPVRDDDGADADQEE